MRITLLSLILILLNQTPINAADWVNGRGLTRLYNAVLSHDPAKVERRLETGADINFRATGRARYPGRTPLYEAVTINNSRIVKVLLDHGADPDIPDAKGKTPLLQASYAEAQPKIVRLLLEAGADPTISNNKGDSPLSLVAGYRVPWVSYTRNHANAYLHQLMLSYIDTDQLEPTMAWRGGECYGYKVKRGDNKLSIVAWNVYHDRERWRELVQLNGLTGNKTYRLGDCLKVF